MALLALALALAASGSVEGPTPAVAINGGRDWVYTTDYPRDALAERRGGSVVMRLRVDSRGMVEECSVVESSGHADLDSISCMAMAMRGRYEPARNADGQRIASDVMRAVRWDPDAANLAR